MAVEDLLKGPEDIDNFGFSLDLSSGFPFLSEYHLE